MPRDCRSVKRIVGDPGDLEAVHVPLQWYGEYLWHAAIPVSANGVEVTLSVEATDAAGNVARSPHFSARGR